MAYIQQIFKFLFKSNLRAISKTQNCKFSSGQNGFNFAFNNAQKELQILARRFVREEVIPVAAHYDKTGEYPTEIVKKAWSRGLMNGNIPKELGGKGMNIFDSSLISEELGYGCSGIMNCLEITRMGQVALLFGGNKDQGKKYLGRLVEEPLVTAFALSEPEAGSDVTAIKTRAQKKGNEWILNGEKKWIINAGVANWYFVLARTNPHLGASDFTAFTAFIVERNSPGVIVGKKEISMGQRATDIRNVKFEDVRVPQENVLTREGCGFHITMSTLNLSRSTVSASATGLAQRCLDEAKRYSQTRKTFGVPLCRHQVIGFMLAEMFIGIEISRIAWMRAAWQVDNGEHNLLAGSIAKSFTTDVANKCATDAVQIFGGNGYNSEYPVEKLMRDAKAYQIFDGTAQIQRIVISREISKKRWPHE